ncbi:hypothetical protein QYE76_020523 [Lolium multiflorum]|uniref:F-box domain-containing protein n=1 Tax=Lolium multiflorum TaxID=4521 RepID=A0AAD8VRE8_LOLMU|nr:hypothetical protein QYE76_020523 [Lolium multiflorum]
MIFEILSRVPLKSMCRFRCVSSEWRAIISDSNFVAAHKSRQKEHDIVVFVSSGDPSKGVYLQVHDIHGNVVSRRKIRGGAGIFSSLSADCLQALVRVPDDYSGVLELSPDFYSDVLDTC